MTLAGRLKEQPLLLGVLSFGAFLLLDWVTFTPAFAPLGITPWNPSVGLGVALVIWGGLGYAPLLAVATFATDILIRQLPIPLWITALEAALTGIAYATALWLLLRPRIGFDKSLVSMRDLLLLTTAAIASAWVVATGYVGVLAMTGILPSVEIASSILSYWVGDVIGIVVLTPFLLILVERKWLSPPTLETFLQSLSILVAIIIVFGLSGELQLQMFYLLLLPIVWIAVRGGLAGVSSALVLMQISMMIALHVGRDTSVDVSAFQAIMLILAFSGLAIGVLISERDRAERRLRLHQDAVARAARQGSMGELATAVAHEINQPLTAISNYARAVRSAVDRNPPAIADARAASEKVVQQIERTAEVIRRLRELIQLGRMQTAPHDIDEIVRESLDLVHHELVRGAVSIGVTIEPGLPRVAVDLIHIEQVLINFLRNAIEAMAEAGVQQPRLRVAARRLPSSKLVEVTVEDNGPGLPDGFRIGSATPITGGSKGGLGVGLSLCQTIVEAHGGTLSITNTGQGARARFTVPIAGGMT